MEDWKTVGGWIVALLGTGSLGALLKWVWGKMVQPGKILIALNAIQSDMGSMREEILSIRDDITETKKIALYNKDGIRLTQRYRLFHDMSKAIADGYVSARRLEEITILYESYVELGGNGTIRTLYSKFIELEVRE